MNRFIYAIKWGYTDMSVINTDVIASVDIRDDGYFDVWCRDASHPGPGRCKLFTRMKKQIKTIEELEEYLNG